MNSTANKLDQFTQAYIEAAFYSSTEYKFGECPCCGSMKLLSHYPEKEFKQEAMCSSEGCGVREIPNAPPMEENYSSSDLAPETLAKMVSDCEQFQNENREQLDACEYGAQDRTNFEMAGHDFWLTRNGHGCGFWDGDLPQDLGDILTGSAKRFGTFDLYAGDDGKIYGSK